jgi:cytochrome c-type biogenesis protein CcsB
MTGLLLLFPAGLLYFVSGGLFIWMLAARRRGVGSVAGWVLVAGWLAHSAALLAHWLEVSRSPVSNLFEFTAFYTWLLVLVYLVVQRGFGQRALGAFVAPLVFVLLAISAFLPRGALQLSPILESPWLPIHAGFSVVAYAFLTISFITSIVFLLQEDQLRHHQRHRLYDLLPPLETTEGLSYRMVELGFPFLVLTIITGALWSEAAWGSFWLWEPKQTAALATMLVYAIYFHARVNAGWRGRRGAWLMLAGFAAVLSTLLGVSLLVPGLHNFTA